MGDGNQAAVRALAQLNGTDARRRELALFLRNRRERLRPEQVGRLPPAGGELAVSSRVTR
jgi:hypothetical protein